MKINSLLHRWEHTLRHRSGPAVLSPSGICLRSWQDVEAEAKELAAHIVPEGGIVVLQTGNHPSIPAILLASWRAERPVCLLDPDFGGEARDGIEQELGATLRVTSSNEKLVFHELPHNSATRSGVSIYKLTSGTTSCPRAIGFTDGQILADCDQVCDTMGICEDDINYGVVAFTHSYGFSNLITPLLCRGTTLVVSVDSLPRAIQSGLRHTAATVLPAVPAIFRALLAVEDLPVSLRLCISAAAPLDPALAREFGLRFHRKIHSFYGTSECGGICYDASEEQIDKAGFVGQPLRGVEIERCAANEGSRIRVRTAAAGVGISDEGGFFEPSDLLVSEPEGFRIVGREADFINVAGKKVNPTLIERVLIEFPGIQEAVVCGRPDARRGEEICALLVTAGDIDIAEVHRYCAERLSSWQVPRDIRVIDAIPTNGRGKISRREIARMFA